MKEMVLKAVMCFIFSSAIIPAGYSNEVSFSWVNNPYEVNGVVIPAGAGSVTGSVCCNLDRGFTHAKDYTFTSVYQADGVDPSKYPKIFVAGYDYDAQESQFNTIYIGAHIEDDPTFSNKDSLVFYFDKDGAVSEGPKDGDFAIVFHLGRKDTAGANVEINEGENAEERCVPSETAEAGCGFPLNTPELYVYSSGSFSEWDFSGITSADFFKKFLSYGIAYDYDRNDLESAIWEFEMKIAVDDMEAAFAADIGLAGFTFKAPKDSAGFGLGAKLTLHRDVIRDVLYSVFCWPPEISILTGLSDYFPSMDDVKDHWASLAEIVFHIDIVLDVRIVADNVTTDAPGIDEPLKVAIPLSTDFSGDVLSLEKQTTFYAEAELKYTGPGTAPPLDSLIDLPLRGKMKYYIRPWSVSSSCGYLMGTVDIDFYGYGSSGRKEIKWPKDKEDFEETDGTQACNINPAAACEDCGETAGGKYPRDKIIDTQGNYVTSHACYNIVLENFSIDTPEGNFIQKNLQYIACSRFKDKFLIEADRPAGASGNEKIEYIIKINPKNIPYKKMSNDLIGMAGAKADSGVPPDYWGSSTAGGEYVSNKPPGEWDKWDIQITNNSGVKNLGKGYFSLSMNPGEEKMVEVEITGGFMPYPAEKVELSPKAGANINPGPDTPPELQALEVNVQPGKIVTIVALGKINIEPSSASSLFNGPNGKINPGVSSTAYRLARPDAWKYAGAVIGSFEKNFTNSFVIGSDATFIVPAGKNKLWIAVNDIKTGYGDNVGKDALSGFTLNILISDKPTAPIRYRNPGNGNDEPGKPFAGSNLPIFDVMVYRAIRSASEPNNVLLVPKGYVTYAAYESHPEYKVYPFELTLPFAGWTFLDHNLPVAGGLPVGAKLGWYFWRPGAVSFIVEAEASCTFTQDSSQSFNYLTNLFLNIKMYIDVIRNFPIQNLAYYIIAGGGYTALFNASGFVSDSPAYNAGIGLNLPLTMRFGLMLEGRCIFIQNLLGVGMTFNPQVVAGLVWRF